MMCQGLESACKSGAKVILHEDYGRMKIKSKMG